MKLCLCLLLEVQMHCSVVPVIHTLKYFHTASSQVPNFPEFVSVGYVDEVQIVRYDSNSRKAEPKQDWMNQITVEDPRYWETQTEIGVFNELVIKNGIEVLMKRYNQTGGVHIVQKMTGCEWNDETDEVKGWYQLGYDGEDLMSLDMKTWTWTASRQQAFPSKLKWDQDKLLLEYIKYYYTEECPYYLKKYVNYGKEVLMRTELPEVFLLQKTPSSPVSCMATGFYPDTADLFWRKDGERTFEDVEHEEIFPNHDGTFQLSVHLKVEVMADVEGMYECVFQLSGVKEDLVTKLERRSILSNASHGERAYHNIQDAVMATQPIPGYRACSSLLLHAGQLERRPLFHGGGHRCGGPPGGHLCGQVSQKQTRQGIPFRDPERTSPKIPFTAHSNVVIQL
ncbi:class I histocompatibility antigen, F10 alpha chain-like isoform X2 [Nerophis ophidion]|uniref:class I histocompatibility antigen, F10 alpha chain-like isoform X2 n=1 Tax=Nerophis ophidion TaxID=159077 RepID=UPI002ADFE657|nr:class I histocompatibility antigen, F10 alpha chain-like isoform X2 [Nerophis ophidion]